MRVLPPSPPTVPDAQHYCIRFLMRESFADSCVALHDLRWGKRVARQDRQEFRPRELLLARAAFQPFPPYLGDLSEVLLQRHEVPRDAVVAIMAYQLRSQPVALSGIGRCRLIRHHSLIAISARARRLLAVHCRTTFFPFCDFAQTWVKPRKSNGGGLQSGCVPPWRSGRKSMKRVLSGWSVSPYRSSRFPGTSRTRLASW